MSRQEGADGYALASVTILGVVAMLAAASFIQEKGISEAHELDNQLVRIRADWAAIGMLNYAVSRGRQDGICKPLCDDQDSARALNYQLLSEEIYNSNGSKIKVPGSLRWFQYPEIHPEYNIAVSVQVLETGSSSDGDVEFILQYEESNDKKLKQQIGKKQRWIAHVCTSLPAVGAACQTGLAKSDKGGIARIAEFRVNR